MKNTKPIYTIGHRNPDTDSICSAIGYAHLKQAMGENVVPARAGKINEETKFALNHFRVEQPLLITDLYPRVKDITLDCKTVVKETDSLRHLGEIMRENDLKSVPVVNKEEQLVGIVTVSDLAQRYFKELSMQNLADAGVSFRDMIRVIDGEVIVSGDEGGKIRGNVRIAAGSISMIQDVVKEHDVVLIGDRRDETLIDCLKQGIDCMIVTGNGRVSPSVIEEAKILEIIDHHRLGGIQTSEPIFTRQEPVGCTATIVANMHWHRDVDIPPSIAGLLLSAILSDTVLFKSPTCTPYDKKTAERLAEIAGVDIMEYGMAMLKAGSGIGNMSPLEITKNDMKEFQIGDYRIIVSQISVMDTKEVMDIEAEIVKSMADVCKKEGYDMSLVMVTDIIAEGTYLLYTGSPKTLIGEAFHKDARGTHIYLPGVMSRKKQIIPPLSEAVKLIKKQ